MSLNRGRPLVQQAPLRRLERPSLDRPSLFAGMEAGDSIVPEDDEQPRGGILSTLESVRRRKPIPGQHGRSPRQARRWQTPALLGFMGLGVLALVGGFIMVVVNGHGSFQSEDLSAATEQAVLRSADAGASGELTEALDPGAAAPTAAGPATDHATVVASPEGSVAITSATTPDTALAAVIENTDGKPHAAQSLAAPAPPSAAAMRLVPSATLTRPSAEAPTLAKADAAATPPKAKRSTGKRPADADVALLEAMLSHTPSRAGNSAAAAAPVAEQLHKACGNLTGAAAATCRARICVSNPGAPACHGSE